jgi:hypothetical protein
MRSAATSSSMSQRPVASARASTVLWLPFLASTGQANPMQAEHRMQACRPS